MADWERLRALPAGRRADALEDAVRPPDLPDDQAWSRRGAPGRLWPPGGPGGGRLVRRVRLRPHHRLLPAAPSRGRRVGRHAHARGRVRARGDGRLPRRPDLVRGSGDRPRGGGPAEGSSRPPPAPGSPACCSSARQVPCPARSVPGSGWSRGWRSCADRSPPSARAGPDVRTPSGSSPRSCVKGPMRPGRPRVAAGGSSGSPDGPTRTARRERPDEDGRFRWRAAGRRVPWRRSCARWRPGPRRRPPWRRRRTRTASRPGRS